MKKVTKILKATLTMVIVLVMAQACVPTGGGGTPTPANGFNVGLSAICPGSLQVGLNFNGSINSKIMNIDGDSIKFVISKQIFSNSGDGSSVVSYGVQVKSTSAYTYEILKRRITLGTPPFTAYDYTFTLGNGSTVSSTPNADDTWLGGNDITGTNLYANDRFNRSFSISLNANSNGAFVIRSLRSDGYHYIYVNCAKTQDASCATSFGFTNMNFSGSAFESGSIVGGNFATNSIIVGQ